MAASYNRVYLASYILSLGDICISVAASQTPKNGNQTLHSGGTPDFEHRAVGVKPDMKVLGPIFRKGDGKVVKALSGLDPADVAQQASGGGMIWVEVGSEVFEVPADAVAIEREVVLGGRAVDVLVVDGATVVITR